MAAWIAVARYLSGNEERGKCAVCGDTSKPCDTHHILPRELRRHKFSWQNAICLCKVHHKYGRDGHGSAHKNSFAFYEWLRVNRPEQYAWCKDQLPLGHNLREPECTLRESYDRLLGVLQEFKQPRELEPAQQPIQPPAASSPNRQ